MFMSADKFLRTEACPEDTATTHLHSSSANAFFAWLYITAGGMCDTL